MFICKILFQLRNNSKGGRILPTREINFNDFLHYNTFEFRSKKPKKSICKCAHPHTRLHV